HEIALIEHRTAELLHVAGAGRLFLSRATLLLSEGPGRESKRKQGESQEIFTHRVPSILTVGKSAAPDRAEASPRRPCRGGRHPPSRQAAAWSHKRRQMRPNL